MAIHFNPLKALNCVLNTSSSFEISFTQKRQKQKENKHKDKKQDLKNLKKEHHFCFKQSQTKSTQSNHSIPTLQAANSHFKNFKRKRQQIVAKKQRIKKS